MKQPTIERETRGIWNLPSDVVVCLATAGGCFAVGALGWLAHRWIPAANNLWAISWIGAFYLLLAAGSFVRGRLSTGESEQAAELKVVDGGRDERRVA